MESRQKLLPWLEGILNKGDIPGMQWLDADKTKFRMPWVRGGKGDIYENDGRKEIYKRWAIHTGKYREGIDKPDYVTWKSRLRCALNKSKDIELLNEEGRQDNQEPYRVYQIVSRRREPAIMSQPEIDQSQRFQVECIPAVQTILLPTVEPMVENLPSDLMSIESNNLLPYDSNNYKCIQDLSVFMDSIQLEASEHQFEQQDEHHGECILYDGHEEQQDTSFSAHLKIIFGETLFFEEKLDKSQLESGFIFGYVGCGEMILEEVLKCDCLKMSSSDLSSVRCYFEYWDEFSPGFMIKLINKEVLAFSCVKSPLKCKSLYSEFGITPFQEEVLLRQEGQNTEQVEIRSPSEVYLISITIKNWKEEAALQVAGLDLFDLMIEKSFDNIQCPEEIVQETSLNN